MKYYPDNIGSTTTQVADLIRRFDNKLNLIQSDLEEILVRLDGIEQDTEATVDALYQDDDD